MAVKPRRCVYCAEIFEIDGREKRCKACLINFNEIMKRINKKYNTQPTPKRAAIMDSVTQ